MGLLEPYLGLNLTLPIPSALLERWPVLGGWMFLMLICWGIG